MTTRPLTYLGLLVVLLALLAAGIELAMSNRPRVDAQSAAATVRSARINTWGAWLAGEVSVGWSIDYSFHVEGVEYRDTERRLWYDVFDVAGERPQVCYDPADPARSHSLERAAYNCSNFDPNESRADREAHGAPSFGP